MPGLGSGGGDRLLQIMQNMPVKVLSNPDRGQVDAQVTISHVLHFFSHKLYTWHAMSPYLLGFEGLDEGLAGGGVLGSGGGLWSGEGGGGDSAGSAAGGSADGSGAGAGSGTGLGAGAEFAGADFVGDFAGGTGAGSGAGAGAGSGAGPGLGAGEVRRFVGAFAGGAGAGASASGASAAALSMGPVAGPLAAARRGASSCRTVAPASPGSVSRSPQQKATPQPPPALASSAWAASVVLEPASPPLPLHSASSKPVLLYLLQALPPRLRPLSASRSASVWVRPSVLLPFAGCPRRSPTRAEYPSSNVRDELPPPGMLLLSAAKLAVALLPRPLNCTNAYLM